MNPSPPLLTEITPGALSTCRRWASARGVTTEAMISGCTVAHLLHSGAEPGGSIQIGSLVVTRQGFALHIRTADEFAAFYRTLVNTFSEEPHVTHQTD